MGDEEVLADIKERSQWLPQHYAIMEKNAKARQLILCGLTRTDIDKVISMPSAKEMWGRICGALQLVGGGNVLLIFWQRRTF